MVRVVDPRDRWRDAFDTPRVNPSGEKVNLRVGPGRDTSAAAGPGSDQRVGAPALGAMVSAVESIDNIRTCPRLMAMIRARWCAAIR